MVDDLRSEHLRSRLCAELRLDGVKLWLSPYWTDGNRCHHEIQNLADKLSKKLNLDVEECTTLICNIQNDALMKLEERNHLNQAKIATLRIRCKDSRFIRRSKDPGTSVNDTFDGNQAKISISLLALGRDLEEALMKDFSDSNGIQQVKLICDGRILKRDESLQSQGITNSSRIMAITLSQPSQIESEAESNWSVCDKTHSAISTMLACGDNGRSGPELGLESQQGCSLSVDAKEKKSLILAMTLHERGRSAMKRDNLSLALVLFSDADQQFKKCGSEILKNADNVALLNLDIVWCYLRMRSVSHISDAERRLLDCESQFERCYGKNLERVMAVKGSAGNEAALLARLHLLQGIVCFHQNKIDASRHLLEQTKAEIQSLKVSQEDINKLVLLGFSPSEALLGLRFSFGNIDAAVQRIYQDREDKATARKENKLKRALERERQKLGKTADGSQFVEPVNVQKLVAMGFDRHLAISALKHSNNIISQAVFLIQEQPHLLRVKKKCVRPSNETIAQFAALGFDVNVAYHALHKHDGNIERAVDDLISNNGIIEYSPDLPVSWEMDEGGDEEQENSNSPPLTDEQLKVKKEQDLRLAEATEELEKDLPTESDDYLNVSLEMEEQFLMEYLSVLQEAS